MNIISGENYSSNGFMDDVRSIKRILRSKEPTFLGTKGKVTMYHIADSYSNYIYMEKKTPKGGKDIIGMLQLGAIPNGVMGYGVYATYIKRKNRGKGYGTAMYLGAVHVLGKIHSSTCIGEMAVRTWHSISKYHKLEIYNLDSIKCPHKWKDEATVPRIKSRGRNYWGPNTSAARWADMDEGYEYFHMVISRR